MGALSRWLASLVRLLGRLTRSASLRDVHLYGGWLLLTAGSVWAAGAWGFAIGGACMFGVGVFGISRTRG